MIYKATELKITKTRLNIGIKEPFKLLHVTDTHLIYSDEQDSETQRRLMAMRREAYDSKHGDNCCRRWADELFKYANEHDAMIVHTGDLIDYVSHGNLVQAKALLDTQDDYFFIAGNHEFTQYMGLIPGEPEGEFKARHEAEVQAIFKQNIQGCARVYKGVNLVGIYTDGNQVSHESLEFLRSELKRGLPTLVFYHEPIYTHDLYEHIVNVEKENDHLTAGEPDELHSAYSSYHASEDTMAFAEEIRTNPLIKGAFTGHLHFTYDNPMPSGAYQYLTAGSFLGMAREIEIV